LTPPPPPLPHTHIHIIIIIIIIISSSSSSSITTTTSVHALTRNVLRARTHTHTHTPQRIRGIKFWDVVPLDHLLARLEGETPGNAALIVELLQSSYFPTDKSEATRVTRCLQMAQSQPRAARVFFRHLAQFVPGASGPLAASPPPPSPACTRCCCYTLCISLSSYLRKKLLATFTVEHSLLL
jgi:hypothetical protein